MPLSGMLAGKRPLDLFWLVQIGPFDLPEAFKRSPAAPTSPSSTCFSR